MSIARLTACRVLWYCRVGNANTYAPLENGFRVVAPSTRALLTQWNWEPSVLLGIVVLIVTYLYAVGPLWRRRNVGSPVVRKQVTYFVLSVATLVVALLSPVDEIGDRYLFSVHMVQHLLLAAVWPPLLLLALPAWLMRPVFQRQLPAELARFFTYPFVAFVLFNVDIYAWHVPYLYDLTLSSESIHIAEHVSFMLFGLLNWWPVLSPLREQRLAYPLQVLYLFVNGMFMMVLGILFTFSPTVFYAPYEAAPRLWGLSAGTDQQLGGLIMWYPGNIPYGVLLIAAFYRWFDDADPGRAEKQSMQAQSPTIESPLP